MPENRAVSAYDNDEDVDMSMINSDTNFQKEVPKHDMPRNSTYQIT